MYDGGDHAISSNLHQDLEVTVSLSHPSTVSNAHGLRIRRDSGIPRLEGAFGHPWLKSRDSGL